MVEHDDWARALVGSTLGGRYRLDRLIGAGGMGAVFVSTNTSIGKRVAVKLMMPALARNAAFVERFRREAQSAAVAGPGVVDVLDLDVDPEHGAYMVMEYLEGETLTARLDRDGAMVPAEAAELTARVLDGLAAVHAAGVVHRDLKPDNVFLFRDEQGRLSLKLLDFGVAKIRSAAMQTMRLTMPGTPVGTPRYMAPEQARGLEDVDHRADIYAAGLLLHGCLAGQPPYGRIGPAELIRAALQGPPQSLRTIRPGLDEGLYQILDRAMQIDRNARFQSAREMAEALRAVAARMSMAPPQPAAGAPVASLAPPADRAGRMRVLVMVGIAVAGLLAVAVIVVAGVALYLTSGDDAAQAAPPAPTPIVQPPPPMPQPPAPAPQPMLEPTVPPGPAPAPSPSPVLPAPGAGAADKVRSGQQALAAGDIDGARAAFERALTDLATAGGSPTGAIAAQAHLGLGDIEMRRLEEIRDRVGDRNPDPEDGILTTEVQAIQGRVSSHYRAAGAAEPSLEQCVLVKEAWSAEVGAVLLVRLNGGSPEEQSFRFQAAATFRRDATELYQRAVGIGEGRCREEASLGLSRMGR